MKTMKMVRYFNILDKKLKIISKVQTIPKIILIDQIFKSNLLQARPAYQNTKRGRK